MEFVSLIFEPVVKALMGHITQKLRNLTSSADRVKKMIKKWEVLEEKRTVIENRRSENEVNIRKIPPRVPGWLKEVETIKEDVEHIPSNNIGCFNVKKKYLAGRNSLRVTQEIECLIDEYDKISSDTIWLEPEGCLGRVNSKIPASASTPSVSVFNSRVKTFNDALKLLKQDADDDTARVIALCGLGGVWKTTLMKQLKEAAHDNKMFNWIVVVVVGKSSNLFAIQNAIAMQTGKPLTETDEKLRATYLSKRFKGFLERKQKILVILDDVWEKIKLEDIGLGSPLPNGVKLLLTSRDENICRQIAVDADSVLEVVRVDVLEEGEVRDFFSRIAGLSVFNSRVKTFNDALKLLQQDDDDTARVIALCGMGGVGKTTLKKQLKEVAKKEKMFNRIADVDIGNTPDLLKIQKEIAVQTGDLPSETDVMATYLSKRFEVLSEKKQKTLVILDDVWEKSKIKLEDIGLASPLPNGVKLLLTSRDKNVCQQIAADVDADSAFGVVKVDVLEEGEARDFFCQKAGISAEHNHDLYEIGCKIVKKCGYLPLAINLIARALKSKGQNKSIWQHYLDSLEKYEDNSVQKIVEISYKNLEREEDKAIFLLCGLFPEDSNIPIEDLTRYAWGLKLLNKVYTMEKARGSIENSVSNLKNVNLLMDGDSHHSDCVKLHDIVLAFVVNTVSKGVEDGCWIIHHEDDFSNWSEANSMISQTGVKQISLSCKGMSEFPTDFKFPDLRVLKLVQGDKSLRFREDFYVGMEQLQVIALEKLKYPLVPTSSANLRTLCLVECSLMFDLTCIGNLSNLEVLSFANSRITILPSSFGNLKKLKLLDVTGCYKLDIDDGVLESLVKLEELYMRGHALCFTENNSSELAERSKNLCALEFEFVGDNAHMKNMSYEKLQRFKLSLGCNFSEVRDKLEAYQVDTHSYENSLKLVTKTKELLESKINKLFEITVALYLQVNDMKSVKDVEIPDPPRYSSFCNLRLLVVSECTELKYLFTPSVAKNLSKLEYLDISGCPIMEAVILIHTENNVSDIIKFSNLKYLKLANLPKLVHFCNNDCAIELPCLVELQLQGLQSLQSFFHKEDATPKLEKLVVSDMENMKEIWPPQFSISNLCPLRELTVVGCGSIEVLFNMDFGEIEQLSSSSLRSIKVDRCNSLVKLFSCNPFPFLNNLQQLEVRWCASVEVIFDIDMGCVGEMDKVSSSRLRSIDLRKLGKLREVWRIKDAGNNLIHGFEAVESILIRDCERFENLITPATTNLDMRAVKQVQISKCGRERERKNELVEKEKEISKIAFPLPSFNNLHKLILYESYEDVEVVFEITSPISRESPHNTQQQLIILPNLEDLGLFGLEKMSHVWKCNWNEFFQKQPSKSSFHNLTTITMWDCNSIKYLFSPLMAKLLSSLKLIYIQNCDAIEEVVSNRDDEDVSINSHTTASVGMVFPRLKCLSLVDLPNFVGFFLGKNEFTWPALEKVLIGECHK